MTNIECNKKEVIAARWKYSKNIWRNFEMPLINCEINFILTWYKNWVNYTAATATATAFVITNTKLSSISNWNKYQSKVLT